MQIGVGKNSILIVAPAKLNLFLNVLGKRPDGFHEIETLMSPISLCDELEFSFTSGSEIQLYLELPQTSLVSGDPAWEIPDDDRNLVVRSVKSVREALGVTGGCKIRLKKAIPAAAGLGGGSSNAASAVVAALLAWGKWDRELALSICHSLGSDVGFFLGDQRRIGMALATGRGEKCEILSEQPDFDFLVLHPPAGCATSAVYANLIITDPYRTSGPITEACRTGDRDRVGALLFNSLQLSARSLTDWIDKQLEFLQIEGCEHRCMSGSGSSCFALIADTRRISKLRRAALDAGLTRAYAVKSWYSSSIEDQIRHSGRFN